MRTQSTESEGKQGLQKKSVVNDPVVTNQRGQNICSPYDTAAGLQQDKGLDNALRTFAKEQNSSQNHGIAEYAELEGTCKDHESNT